jgi:hypothetical protein
VLYINNRVLNQFLGFLIFQLPGVSWCPITIS